jgi:hypothetical protein
MDKNAILDLNTVDLKKSLIEFCFSKSKKLKFKYNMSEDWLKDISEHISNIKKKFKIDEIINCGLFQEEAEWSLEKPLNELYCTIYGNESKFKKNVVCSLIFSLESGKMTFKDVDVLITD